MKVTVEGTPEELARLGIVEWFSKDKAAALVEEPEHEMTRRDAGATTPGDAESAASSGRKLPSALRDLIRRLARGNAGELTEAFISEILTWERVGAVSPPPDGYGSPNYVRLRYPGSPKGSFVYVYPQKGRVVFRLLKAEAGGCKHAAVRPVKESDAYQVDLYLTSEDAKAEALVLARKAYEEAVAFARST